MATLERSRDSTSTTTAVDQLSTTSTYAATATVPSGPVPRQFPEQQRGRPPLSDQRQDSSDSRSPNGTRRSLSKIGDRIKRAVSQAREPSINGRTSSNPDSGEGEAPPQRGRSWRNNSRDDADNNNVETRGRSPSSILNPRQTTSRGRTSVSSQGGGVQGNNNSTSQYPLSATQTRSSSLPRTINSMSSGSKIVSTGRGGAGNLVGFSTTEEVPEFTGEEDPDLLARIREDRSKSREREGRVEVAYSGRGGRGNIRSQSRNRDVELGRVPTVLEEQEKVDREDEVLREEELRRRQEREASKPQPQRWVSSGRGGAGNFYARQTSPSQG